VRPLLFHSATFDYASLHHCLSALSWKSPVFT
jgi:hypothetical protein